MTDVITVNNVDIKCLNTARQGIVINDKWHSAVEVNHFKDFDGMSA